MSAHSNEFPVLVGVLLIVIPIVEKDPAFLRTWLLHTIANLC